MPFLHHLEERRLHLRRGSVDLVREQEVAEDGPDLDVELGAVGPVDAGADEIGRHEVRRELDAMEGAAEDGRGRLDGQRLRETRDSLEEKVPARQQRDERALEEDVLACDHASDLVHRLLDRAVDSVAVGYGSNLAWVTHAVSFSRERRGCAPANQPPLGAPCDACRSQL